MTEPTLPGASESAETVVEGAEVTPMNPRQAYMEGLAERLETERREELKDTMAHDPDLKRMQEEREAEMGIEPITIPDAGGLVVNNDASELVPTSTRTNGTLPDFIVQQDDGLFFRAKVDGEERLIPLEQARNQLQKEEAVESRFRYVNGKVNELTERERALEVRERNLQTQPAKVSPPSSQDVDDESLQTEARTLVNKLFTATEDEAAAELVRVLRNNRVPATAPIDPDTLVDKAADAALDKLEKRDTEKDAKAGFSQFGKDYPEIVNDPRLFKVADDMTNEVAAEHPDWKPSQVMSEAGRRTLEWHKGAKPTVTVPTTEPETNIRQIRKEQLTPIPPSGSLRHEVSMPEEPETPGEALKRMREARGQPA